MDKAILTRIQSDPDLAARVMRMCEPEPEPVRIETPSSSALVFRPLLDGRETEAFAVAALDRRLRVIDAAIMTTGNDVATVVDPKQILRWALTRKRTAHAIIVAHNHPSGDTSPSQQDDQATRSIKAACSAVGLKLFDHIILTDGAGFYSYAATGNL